MCDSPFKPEYIYVRTSGSLGWAREYLGNQVWRLQVDTSSQIDQLASLEVTEYMDFWTEVPPQTRY